MPNIVYPALQPVLAETAATIYLLLPPPKAVGESPPGPLTKTRLGAGTGLPYLAGPFLADILAQFNPNQQQLLKYAATTLFLEEAIDETEAAGYLIRTKKQHIIAPSAAGRHRTAPLAGTGGPGSV
jgi:hypothetical protein